MRMSIIVSAAVLASSCAVARACDAGTDACADRLVAVPVYRLAGYRYAVAPVRPRPPFELSRFTDQPLTVVYNDPGLDPSSVDPGSRLVRLPAVRRHHAQAVSRRGD